MLFNNQESISALEYVILHEDNVFMSKYTNVASCEVHVALACNYKPWCNAGLSFAILFARISEFGDLNTSAIQTSLSYDIV